MGGFGAQYGIGQYGMELDGSPPFLYDQVPYPGATGVEYTASVAFDVLSYSGFDPSTLVVHIDGVLAVDAGVFQTGFSGSVSSVAVDGYAGYRLVIDHDVPFDSKLIHVRVEATDFADNALDETYGFHTRNKVVSLVCSPYEVTLDLGFSGPMLLSSLLDASRYQFTGGVYARYVEPIPANNPTPTNIRLWVEGFEGTESTTLTVSPLVRDADGNILANEGRTATVSPFPSAAFFSNTTGLVRSWHESRVILRDTKRAYLAGLRGIDVFDIAVGPTEPMRWSQILDAYGIGAACLLGTEDHAFEDTTAPFLSGRIPSPGATGVSIGATIRMTVADADTAVEAVALTIYVNGRLAFSGTAGWSNGYGGHVMVGRQALGVQLLPPPGGLVVGLNTVAVVAADLVGNLLDTSYTFTVGAPPPSMGGFGEGSFGEAPFGE